MEKIFDHTRYFLVFIIGSSLGITYLHYSTLPGVLELHNIFTELYYVPILLGALAFGLRGAVITYLFVTLLYVPYVVVHWSGTNLFIINKIFHAVFSGTFAVLAGVLSDRERKRQEQVDKDRYLAGLGRAAAAIVHDLKNPIITIRGFSRRIMQRKGDIDTAARIVNDSAKHMEAIVHNVLDFARAVQLDRREDNINRVLEKACESCETKAADAGVALSLDLPAGPVIGDFDSIHMQRALVNLISNAIEASAKHDVVAVSSEAVDDSISVRIKDNGKGMDKEALENIFIPFYTSKSSGTGIGTAIAKKVIEGHKGRIRVNSRPGLGTEILIKLPASN